jgi:hypothetical protein
VSPLAGLALLTAASEPTTSEAFSAFAGAYYYLVPSSTNTTVAIGSVDLRSVHLEARYGYEDRRTGSVFLGHRFDVSFVRPLELTVTPILGAVFGRTYGVAPGLEIDARLWRLELSSQSEWVLDGASPDASFFYNWSELVLWPVDWLQAGAVLQRTRFVHENLAIEPGAVVGCTLDAFTAKAYSFNPLSAERFYGFALEAEF